VVCRGVLPPLIGELRAAPSRLLSESLSINHAHKTIISTICLMSVRRVRHASHSDVSTANITSVWRVIVIRDKDISLSVL